jgi:hypothetical protein
VARTHYWPLIAGCIERYASVLVVEDYSVQEMCTVSCTNAKPETVNECECVCGGDAHGQQRGSSRRVHWVQIGSELLIGTEYRRRTFRVSR